MGLGVELRRSKNKLEIIQFQISECYTQNKRIKI